MVYIRGDNVLDALDAATGAICWRAQVPYDGYVESTPVVADGVVYFSGDGVYALNAQTGRVLWHNALGWDSATVVTPPVLVGRLVVASVIDGGGRTTLVALDAASGAAQWRQGSFNQTGSAAAG